MVQNIATSFFEMTTNDDTEKRRSSYISGSPSVQTGSEEEISLSLHDREESFVNDSEDSDVISSNKVLDAIQKYNEMLQ